MKANSLANESGSITVFIAIAVPLLAIMLAVVVDCGRIIVKRTRLDIAADRAAFAGAESLARSMNEIAAQNWHIHKAWRDLESGFLENSEHKKDRAEELIRVYEGRRNEAFDKIDLVRGALALRAREAALSLFQINDPRAAAEAIVNADAEVLVNADRANQWGRVEYTYMEGGNVFDPVRYVTRTYEGLKYLLTRPDAVVAIEIEADETVQPMLLKKYLKDGVKIHSNAFAQAHAGSISAFAKKTTDTIENAEGELDENGADGLYRASFILATPSPL